LGNSTGKIEWGHVEKIGKDTKASYDSQKKVLLFCFERSPQTSSEDLRKSRELLMRELKELGYDSHMKYNGEVIVDNVDETNLVLVKKNHKLLIRLNKKQAPKIFNPMPEPDFEGQSNIKFS
jgi:hypothetical protein